MSAYDILKRACDIVGACVLIVLFSPLLLACAIAVRLETPGPALYRGTRLGRGRTPFTVYKFRSMHHGVPDDAHREYVAQLLTGAADMRGGMYKLTDDDRVTRVGAFLRKWSLDELPQLFNVVRGEMSLVGPRPEVPYAVDSYEPWQLKRFDVLPGLTGLWQVNGRAQLSPRDMLALDCRYAEERSLWTDTRILLRTIPSVVGRIGSA